MVRAVVFAGFITVLAPAAAAQVTVIGGGLARDCYEAAKYGLMSQPAAEQLCTRALEHETMNLTNKAATFTNRGVLRMRQGKVDGALTDYAASKRIMGDSGPTWLNEGAAYILKKDYEAALVSLNRAIELDSSDLFAAYYNRALARERLGDIQGAYYDLVKSRELNPDFPQTDEQLSRFTVERH